MDNMNDYNLCSIAYILANVQYVQESSRLLYLTKDTYHDERIIIPLMYYGYGKYKRTYLQYYCYANRIDRVKECIKYRADPDFSQNQREPSSVVWCILQGYVDILQYLMTYYYEPHYQRYIPGKSLIIPRTSSLSSEGIQLMNTPRTPSIITTHRTSSSSSSSVDSPRRMNHSITASEDSASPSTTASTLLPIPKNYRVMAETRTRTVLFSSLIHLAFGPKGTIPLPLTIHYTYNNGTKEILKRPVTLVHCETFRTLLFNRISSSLLSSSNPSSLFTVFWSSEAFTLWGSNLSVAVFLCKDDASITIPSSDGSTASTTSNEPSVHTAVPVNTSSESSSSLLSIQIQLLLLTHRRPSLALPIKASVLSGNHQLFKYIYSSDWALTAENFFPTVGNIVAYFGDIELFQWVRSQDDIYPQRLDENVCASAAEGGKLTFIQWLRNHDPPCLWDARTCSSAAMSGNLELLVWLRNRIPNNAWTVETYYNAASEGHLHIIEWLFAQRPSCPMDSTISYGAAHRNQVHILHWLKLHTPPFQWDERIFSHLAYHGQLEFLQWLKCYEYPYQWNSGLCSSAVMGGQYEVVRWLRSVDPPIPFDEYTCMYAVEYDHQSILQYLREQGCPWDDETCNAAVRSRNREMLIWLRNQNPPAPWSTKTCLTAVKYWYLDLLQWLHDHGCPWDEEVCAKMKRYLVKSGADTTTLQNFRLRDYIKCDECPCHGTVCRPAN